MMKTNNGNEMINDWTPEVRWLLARLKRHGFTLLAVDNGDEYNSAKDMSDEEFLAETVAADEATVEVQAPDGKRLTLFLIFGNSPGEVVCDYTCHPLLDVVVDEHFAAWDGQPQPMIERGAL